MPAAAPAFLERKVSARMRVIVECLEDGWPTWDLCCDHGLIGLWAWHTRSIPELHFVDRIPGIIARLEREVSQHMNPAGLHFHPVDAVSLVLPMRPCNIILSGIGFRSLERIVAALYPTPRNDRLVVSVHAEEEYVAPFLSQSGWHLVQQSRIEEDGRGRIVGAWQGTATDATH